MKLSTLLLPILLPCTLAFTTIPTTNQKINNNNTPLTTLSSSRRSFIGSIATATPLVTAAALTITTPLPAFAKDYEPKFDDMKQIYGLGVSLDNLAAKVSDPNQFEAALEGIRMFNRDPKFYPGYARNYISKSVKNNADGDSRVGYVRQACNVISSLQELLEGRQGLEGKAAADEAVKRVKRAQELLALFIKESGVTDDRLAAFVSAH